MNAKLANTAKNRATAGLGEQRPMYCARWVRQCIEERYGTIYDAILRSADSAGRTTARASALKWLKLAKASKLPDGVTVIHSSDVADTQVGDIVYCTNGHGVYGHVGIRTWGNRVAENTVRRSFPSKGTKGGVGYTHGSIAFSALSSFGFDVIVRLP